MKGLVTFRGFRVLVSMALFRDELRSSDEGIKGTIIGSSPYSITVIVPA